MLISQTGLEQWRTVQKVRPQKEDKDYLDERAILDEIVVKIREQIKPIKGLVFLDRLIHDPASNKHYDYTLLVVTPTKLTLIELKNWKGKLEADNFSWKWTTARDEMRPRPNQVSALNDKIKFLETYLKNQGIELPKNFIEAKLLLTNPDLEVSPFILKEKAIVAHDKIEDFIKGFKGLNRRERIAQKISEITLSKEKSTILFDGLYNAIPSKTYQALGKCFKPLRTWDTVGYFGGKVVRGHLVRFVINQDDINGLDELRAKKTIKVNWTRGPIIGAVYAGLFRRQLCKIQYNFETYKLNPITDKVVFKQVGTQDEKAIPLVEIEWLKRG